MRVFLAGASGAIGRSLVPQLVAAGHDVTGTTRSEQRAEAIRAAGGRAAVCDVLDANALRAAVAEAAADVVVDELTALPERLNPRNKRLYDATNRVRRDGTVNLLTAARAARARRFICQSIAFAYAPDRRPRVMGEDAPLFLAARRDRCSGPARRARRLQRGRRRACADVRLAARVCRGDRREATPAHPRLAGSTRGRSDWRADEPPGRRHERKREACARMGAALAELAPRIPRGTALIGPRRTIWATRGAAAAAPLAWRGRPAATWGALRSPPR
jgi:hypothetical protein